MKTTLLIIATLIIPAGAFAQAQEFDLKGDKLGDSLALFKMRHPEAKCNPDANAMCFDSEAHFGGHWPSRNPGSGGLTAHFSQGKLKSISYHVVANGGGDILKVLTEKFGKPSQEKAELLSLPLMYWENQTQELSFIKFSSERGIEEIFVSLKYREGRDPENKDI